jgi:predicted ATPase/DNA-binding CsgD family transcriptional regulator
MDIADRTIPTGSLPTPLTSLVGREREMAEIAMLVRDPGVRLVTLTGPGGVGKTRLAIKAARQAIDAFPDGIRFVDLSPIKDPAIVAFTIAYAFGLRAGSDPVQLLLSVIGQFRLLLLIDNFEQVVESAPVVAELLIGAPGLSVLVTSREPLKVSGEQEYPIAPLTVPSTGQLGPHDLTQLDAVRLFAERARAVLPTFAIAPDNAVQIADICRRLDGLPLAIELAAARVKTLPPTALLARLEQRLPLLTGTRRDAPVRQQTMRDAIAWSYDLLPGPEQVLFRRLSVFVGGFTLDAADIVSLAPGSADVFDGVASLVDKSLLRQESTATGEARYHMLETIREFAAEQLAVSGERDRVRDAHAAWCIELGEQWWAFTIASDPYEAGQDQMPLLISEYANLRAAIGWMDQTGNDDGIARLTGAICVFLNRYGHRGEGRAWLERARNPKSGIEIAPAIRMQVLRGISIVARNRGEYDEASAAAHEFGKIARALGDRTYDGLSHLMLDLIALAQGDFDRAESLGLQAVDLLQKREGYWWSAITQGTLGQAALGKGELERAAAIFEQLLTRYRERNEQGATFDRTLTLADLGLVRTHQGRGAEAAACFAAALPFWRAIDNGENLAEWLAEVATLAAIERKTDLAAHLLGAASALRASLEHAFSYPERASFELAERMSRHAMGEQAFSIAWQQGAATPADQAIADASTFLASAIDPSILVEAAMTSNPLNLTPRECDVLRLLVEGRSDREIAESLFIGTRTVETHVSNLIAKLGVHNRTEAATLATRERLV